MSSITVDTRDRDYDESFNKSFRLHRILGLFPFHIAGDSLHTPLKLFVSTAVMVAVVISSLFLMEKEFDMAQRFIGQRAFKLTYFCPLVLFAITPVYNVLWLLYNKNKINDTFRAIRDVEALTKRTSSDVKNVSFYVSLLLLIFNQTIYYSVSFTLKSHLISAIFHFLTLVYNLSVLCQFSSLINIIQSQYNYISDTLYTNTAEIWSRCHDRLDNCCSMICDSYSPQLLLIVLSNFISITTHAYQMLVTSVPNLPYLLTFVYWMFLHFSTSWYIVFCCSETIKKARKFDDLLYELIANDPDQILLKNKRIVLHLKTKRKDEFSAMGLFKFDYPLLCSMVSSATTYMIVLVQFSE